MVVYLPGGPAAQLANLSFFLAALVSDVLLIRFFLVSAYLWLLICEGPAACGVCSGQQSRRQDRAWSLNTAVLMLAPTLIVLPGCCLTPVACSRLPWSAQVAFNELYWRRGRGQHRLVSGLTGLVGAAGA